MCSLDSDVFSGVRYYCLSSHRLGAQPAASCLFTYPKALWHVASPSLLIIPARSLIRTWAVIGVAADCSHPGGGPEGLCCRLGPRLEGVIARCGPLAPYYPRKEFKENMAVIDHFVNQYIDLAKILKPAELESKTMGASG
ncbi:hypothetical protein QBC37DRAFT_451286 [Rhypophila decipiens]|uniref:Uncharacterized protein n=1 Tax=Rhypophila decipiens TaxID=261697 RepID=A0AAN6Y0F0_9PEZI|nr:hypothetical protein QBC37DRAFT_451286 [Rhypophila decipiens]